MSRLSIVILLFWSYSIGVLVGSDLVNGLMEIALVAAAMLVVVLLTPDVAIYMNKRTAELVQTCIEAHLAKATRIQGNDRGRVNAVIVDLEKQLLKYETKG